MKKNKSTEQALKKQLLLLKIHRQRLELSEASQDWLDSTARYDAIYSSILALRPFVYAAGSILTSAYFLRHPSKIALWGRRAFVACRLAQVVKMLNMNKKD